MALGKHSSAIDRGGTSPGPQIYLQGILSNPTLLVFRTDITRDVHAHQEVIESVHLSIINGQMKHSGGSESGKASGGLCQARAAFLPAWPVSMAFQHSWRSCTAVAWGLPALAEQLLGPFRGQNPHLVGAHG